MIIQYGSQTKYSESCVLLVLPSLILVVGYTPEATRPPATATQIQAEALASRTPLPTISIDEVLRVFDYDADATGRY
jgi:hypothetical protein